MLVLVFVFVFVLVFVLGIITPYYIGVALLLNEGIKIV